MWKKRGWYRSLISIALRLKKRRVRNVPSLRHPPKNPPKIPSLEEFALWSEVKNEP